MRYVCELLIDMMLCIFIVCILFEFMFVYF